ISLATKPHAVCLVPERREELTTEGGLDVVGQHNTLKPFIARLNDAGVRVSLFIAADPAQIEMAARLRAPVIEIHTGAWCVARVIERHGDRFLDRIFTDAERARAGRRAKNEKMVVATYAKRFAAKEACSKALGTGIRRGVWWRDMGVVNLPGGRPTMELTGGALARLEQLTPPGHDARIDLSITD